MAKKKRRDEDTEFDGRGTHNTEAKAVDCPPSIGVEHRLVGTPEDSSRNPMAMDKLSKLRRLYKLEFGFKPAGMSEKEITAALQDRSRSHYGDANRIFDKL